MVLAARLVFFPARSSPRLPLHLPRSRGPAWPWHFWWDKQYCSRRAPCQPWQPRRRIRRSRQGLHMRRTKDWHRRMRWRCASDGSILSSHVCSCCLGLLLSLIPACHVSPDPSHAPTIQPLPGNDNGQLGRNINPTSQETAWADVPGITDALSVTAGNQHACVLRRNGAIACWGNGPQGGCHLVFLSGSLYVSPAHLGRSTHYKAIYIVS
jgi:hypothetical protein